MNPCNEIPLSASKFTTLGDGHRWDDRPNLTYPTVTKWGIVEMTRAQQLAYFEQHVETTQERMVRSTDRIFQLEQRVAELEALVHVLTSSYCTHWHEDSHMK
jgi:hypothetical protein